MSDTGSPGGWKALLNSTIARWLVVGTIAAGGGYGAGQGVQAIYGKSQGAQASHFIEARLVSAAQDTVTYSALNPLPEGWSGSIVAKADNAVMVVSAASPKTRLNICTAASATTPCAGTAAGANVGSGINIAGSKNRYLSLSATGGMVERTPQILAPRDYPGSKRYLNFTFVNGSGQTANGLAPATVRIEVRPCNLSGAGC